MSDELKDDDFMVEAGFDSCDFECKRGLPLTNEFCPVCVDNPSLGWKKKGAYIWEQELKAVNAIN